MFRYSLLRFMQYNVQDKVGSVTRPVKELKAFRRISLDAGQTEQVTFKLPMSQLAFWGVDMTCGIEPGDFKLWVGTSSAEGLEADFQVVG